MEVVKIQTIPDNRTMNECEMSCGRFRVDRKLVEVEGA